MDVLQIAPIGCLFPRLRVNAFGSLFAIMAINAAVIGISIAVYGVRKTMILRNRNQQNEDKLRKISEIKELVFRNLFFLLYACMEAEEPRALGSGMEIISGLRFLFENYELRAWYWELVETSRKVILTSGLILVGQESRSYIGLAWIIAGMYGMLFSWIKPIADVTENRLMATSLAVTVVNLGVEAMSRIPAENISASIDTDVDAVAFKILVFGANFLVIGLLVGKLIVVIAFESNCSFQTTMFMVSERVRLGRGSLMDGIAIREKQVCAKFNSLLNCLTDLPLTGLL